MATAVVMPALEMAQETGVLVRWLKVPGEAVEKGEPVMEVETDKATVEIESPGAGLLGGVSAKEGDVVPVGRTIAWILDPGEEPPEAQPENDTANRARATSSSNGPNGRSTSGPGKAAGAGEAVGGNSPERGSRWAVTPLARNVAEENGVDLSQITPKGSRIEKADILDYLGGRVPTGGGNGNRPAGSPASAKAGKVLASPKARRIAAERSVDLSTVAGSGPEGAVLASDVMSVATSRSSRLPAERETSVESLGNLWRTMAQRMGESWSSVPHFYLAREVEATGLLEWRKRSEKEVLDRAGVKLTLTDLLVKCAGFVLHSHPRINSSWEEGSIRMHGEVNVGIAVAVEEGLVVPVVNGADRASLSEIAGDRSALISRARERKLRPQDLSGGTFTITNLGMYNVDAFNAIVNPPQSAILAVGRVADRVVPVAGKPEVRPMMTMTLSCDHRAVDGARAAQFLDDLAKTIEDPWRLLV